jgi:hypothetical protein
MMHRRSRKLYGRIRTIPNHMFQSRPGFIFSSCGMQGLDGTPKLHQYDRFFQNYLGDKFVSNSEFLHRALHRTGLKNAPISTNLRKSLSLFAAGYPFICTVSIKFLLVVFIYFGAGKQLHHLFWIQGLYPIEEAYHL